MRMASDAVWRQELKDFVSAIALVNRDAMAERVDALGAG
jgi:hypothetical protein